MQPLQDREQRVAEPNRLQASCATARYPGLAARLVSCGLPDGTQGTRQAAAAPTGCQWVRLLTQTRWATESVVKSDWEKNRLNSTGHWEKEYSKTLEP